MGVNLNIGPSPMFSVPCIARLVQAAGTTMDETTQAGLDAVNSMLLDVLAVAARKGYTDCRRTQGQGIAKAQQEGRYKGRQPDLKRHTVIANILDRGMSWSEVCPATKASRSTVLRVVNAR